MLFMLIFTILWEMALTIELSTCCVHVVDNPTCSCADLCGTYYLSSKTTFPLYTVALTRPLSVVP
ncbi:MAG: hypothetical protein ACI9F2_000583 [Lysobacterales bacterium]|jgi:hypothetical protein